MWEGHGDRIGENGRLMDGAEKKDRIEQEAFNKIYEQ